MRARPLTHRRHLTFALIISSIALLGACGSTGPTEVTTDVRSQLEGLEAGTDSVGEAPRIEVGTDRVGGPVGPMSGLRTPVPSDAGVDETRGRPERPELAERLAQLGVTSPDEGDSQDESAASGGLEAGPAGDAAQLDPPPVAVLPPATPRPIATPRPTATSRPTATVTPTLAPDPSPTPKPRPSIGSVTPPRGQPVDLERGTDPTGPAPASPINPGLGPLPTPEQIAVPTRAPNPVPTIAPIPAIPAIDPVGRPTVPDPVATDALEGIAMIETTAGADIAMALEAGADSAGDDPHEPAVDDPPLILDNGSSPIGLENVPGLTTSGILDGTP